MKPDAFFVSSRKLLLALTLSWLLLWFGSVIQDLVILATGTEEKIWLLDVDSEVSVYTWLSTILLSGAALLSFVLASHGNDAPQWRAIGVIFLAMSMDEMLSLHERLSGVLSSSLTTSGPFFFAWVIPAAVFILMVAVVFLPFVFRLPRSVAIMIIAAGFVYILGALGLEMAAGLFLSGEENLASALESPRYRIMTNLEEGLEVLGVIIFIAALLIRCAQVFPSTFETD
ncbi:hypothetical protein [Wenxinia marina]|nr:hypothetical protein [Wenxinia marina]GGL57059.1 hypothetical protein GCM10011392_09420 [Wenxinia marina]